MTDVWPHLHPVSEAKTLGEAIKILRQHRGHTVRSLAMAVGCSHNFIHMLETGKKTDTDRMAALAEALGVPESFLNSFRPKRP